MANELPKVNWNDPVTHRMQRDFTALRADQTVGQALEWLRQHPPPGRIIYFYVIDADGRLQGVVPTRRLVLSAPEAAVRDIMVGKVTALPARASVLEACEFFVLHRLLAFPVVDDAGKLVGVVDIDVYRDELARLEEARPVSRLLRPLVHFLHIESASGVLLLFCTVVALVLANSPWAEGYAAFWQTPVQIGGGVLALRKPLLLWVNDGLMTLFFFVVGLEIKREMVAGELSEFRKALLPLVAAVGGMVVPAAVYLLFHWGRPTAVGWAIPMATDIAFVVGFLALLGQRVPHALKVFLLSLAIADDIGATLVIAIAYTDNVSMPALLVGAVGFAVVVLFRLISVRRVLAYTVVGTVIWVAFVKSGVHPTVAGVALGLLTPARPWLGDRLPFERVGDLFARVVAPRGDAATRERAEPISPLERLETALHPWVAFVIMPVFALANAGVPFGAGAMDHPVAVAVALGLVVGKPIGITLFSLAAVKLGLARLPEGVDKKVVFSAGCLAGIGFTMSLFIASLALDQLNLTEAKMGILAGSTVSALLGLLLLLRYLPRASAVDEFALAPAAAVPEPVRPGCP